jgi:hypothetical protein
MAALLFPPATVVPVALLLSFEESPHAASATIAPRAMTAGTARLEVTFMSLSWSKTVERPTGRSAQAKRKNRLVNEA